MSSQNNSSEHSDKESEVTEFLFHNDDANDFTEVLSPDDENMTEVLYDSTMGMNTQKHIVSPKRNNETKVCKDFDISEFADKTKRDRTFCKIAIQKNWITHDMASECLQILQLSLEKGKKIKIEEILMEKGYLSSTMVIAAYLENNILRCPRCTKRSRIENRNEKKAICRFCKKVIKLPNINIIQKEDKIMAELIGTDILSYKIQHCLGAGGMGEVYRAIHTRLARPAALKILYPHLAIKEEFIQRFFREARLAAQVIDPHLVQIYDVDESRGNYFIAMEYVEGFPLSNIVNHEKKLSLKNALKILKESTLGLSTLHKKGIIHRDIKPDNIMITKDGVAKLTDFGLAKESDASQECLTKTGSVIGTPHYMSPEQCKGIEVSEQSDIYSLGLTFYYMITGKVPFTGENSLAILQQQINQAAPPLPSAIPNSIEAIYFKMVEKKCEKRYQNTEELLTALGSLKINKQTTSTNKTILLKTLIKYTALSIIFIAISIGFLYFISQKNKNIKKYINKNTLTKKPDYMLYKKIEQKQVRNKKEEAELVNELKKFILIYPRSKYLSEIKKRLKNIEKKKEKKITHVLNELKRIQQKIIKQFLTEHFNSFKFKGKIEEKTNIIKTEKIIIQKEKLLKFLTILEQIKEKIYKSNFEYAKAKMESLQLLFPKEKLYFKQYIKKIENIKNTILQIKKEWEIFCDTLENTLLAIKYDRSYELVINFKNKLRKIEVYHPELETIKRKIHLAFSIVKNIIIFEKNFSEYLENIGESKSLHQLSFKDIKMYYEKLPHWKNKERQFIFYTIFSRHSDNALSMIASSITSPLESQICFKHLKNIKKKLKKKAKEKKKETKVTKPKKDPQKKENKIKKPEKKPKKNPEKSSPFTYISCKFCNGKGRILCKVCKGSDRPGYLPCSKCAKTGKIKCKKCNGIGTIFSWKDSKSIVCPKCRGSKKEICSICKGRKYYYCQNCWKKGYVNCLNCGGKGKIKIRKRK